VILLDTHIWIWWVQDDPMPDGMRMTIEFGAADGLAVSAISCWEVSMLVERGRLEIARDLDEWLDLALHPSGVSLIPISPEIAMASARLPGKFHRDPADQIIVATSRVCDLPLATCDEKIRAYPYVRLLHGTMIHDR
jgi:PIN domain nuclease of toxin-antitoxin system